jgi:hypothetical protein
MKKQFSDFDFGKLIEKVENIEKTVNEIKQRLDADYVTKEEFKPVKTLVYGFTGLILTAVIVALLALVGLKR